MKKQYLFDQLTQMRENNNQQLDILQQDLQQILADKKEQTTKLST